MRFITIALGAALAAAPLSAQAPDSAAIKFKQRVDAMLGIPQKADEARRAGVPDASLRGILDILRQEKVTPEEASAILTTETEAVREHGPTDNFGAFVQTQLAAGKRGQDLAAAIRAEHARNGRGHADDADDKKDKKEKKEKKTERPENPGAKGKRPN